MDSQCAGEHTFSRRRMVQVDILLMYHGLVFFEGIDYGMIRKIV
jgi:hypothetical protein